MTSAELERLAIASVLRLLALWIRPSTGMFLARRSPCPPPPPLPMRSMCCSTPSFPFRGRSPSSVSRTEPVSYATPLASISSRHHTQPLAFVANRSPLSAPGEPATLRKRAPDWHILDCRPSEEARPTTRRWQLGTRYTQRHPRQAGSSSVCILRAPSRAFPLGIDPDLSASVDVVDTSALSPFRARVPDHPRRRSTVSCRGRRGVGCDATLHAHGANDTPNSLAVGTAAHGPESPLRWSHPQQE